MFCFFTIIARPFKRFFSFTLFFFFFFFVKEILTELKETALFAAPGIQGFVPTGRKKEVNTAKRYARIFSKSALHNTTRVSFRKMQYPRKLFPCKRLSEKSFPGKRKRSSLYPEKVFTTRIF